MCRIYKSSGIKKTREEKKQGEGCCRCVAARVWILDGWMFPLATATATALALALGGVQQQQGVIVMSPPQRGQKQRRARGDRERERRRGTCQAFCHSPQPTADRSATHRARWRFLFFFSLPCLLSAACERERRRGGKGGPPAVRAPLGLGKENIWTQGIMPLLWSSRSHPHPLCGVGFAHCHAWSTFSFQLVMRVFSCFLASVGRVPGNFRSLVIALL